MTSTEFLINTNQDGTVTYTLRGVPKCSITFDKIKNEIVTKTSPLINTTNDRILVNQAFTLCPMDQRKYFLTMCAINYS